MRKSSGFDELSKDLKAFERAMKELDGSLGTINYNPHEPASIESAIESMNQLLEERVGQYASNPLVGPLIEDVKIAWRESIIQQAAEARLISDEDE